MTQRTRKSAVDRKEEIVKAAIRLAAETGPDRLTTELLAREIGISQPGIFRHFPKKGDIWIAVAKRIAVFLDTKEEDTAHKGTPASERLVALVTRHLAFIERNPAIPAILFSRELHAENEPLRQFFQRLMDNRQAVFTAVIETGIKREEFCKTLDVEIAAAAFLSLVQGLAMRWSLSGQSFDLVSEGEASSRLLIDGFCRAPVQLKQNKAV